MQVREKGMTKRERLSGHVHDGVSKSVEGGHGGGL